MKVEIFLCSHCFRVVRPEIRATSIGNMQVPPPHKNEDGEDCSGHNAEVIAGWNA